MEDIPAVSTADTVAGVLEGILSRQGGDRCLGQEDKLRARNLGLT
jgi:hypothetical protein